MVEYCRASLNIGKTMSEVGLGVRGTAHSPDSDCNSNHPGSASCLSNTSSQDIDFIQDNSDYQWFLDYGYREGGTNHHTSILSLPESYDANDVGYYDTFAKNMDANLAEADMESFRTEDIHALLTNLPPMCTNHLSQENNRQGESYASVSGSMMAKFDFDSSMSPHSSSQGEDSTNSTSMSICKSELLFSPVKETPMPGANFSVDSLDCDLLMEHDLMLTCQANKDNYTIAFEGSVTMYSEDSDYHESDKSETSGASSSQWTNNLKNRIHHLKALETSMSQSDSGSFTTWSKLKKRNSENQLRRHPSGNNNNNSGDDTSHFSLNENTLKSQSMPNLYKQKIKGFMGNNMQSQNITNSSTDCCTVKRRPVKVFDIQHQVQSSSASGGSLMSDVAFSYEGENSGGENANNKQPNFSLVKLFMKQKSMSAEGMSTTMDQSTPSENWPGSQTSESINMSDYKRNEQSKCAEECLLQQNGNESSSRIHDLIVEEQEDEISRSESVEQLSESISKLESVSYENDLEKPASTNRFNINNNNSIEHDEIKQAKLNKNFIPVHLMNRSIQTSTVSEMNKSASYKLNCNNKTTNIKVIEPSFLNKLKKEGEVEKPVYILYPNYVLPDLDFLKDKQDQVFLKPQGIPDTIKIKKRPFSFNDMEVLKKKGFDHVRDWDSLNILLPTECRQILADVPEVAQFNKTAYQKEKPSFCRTQRMRQKRRPVSCDYTGLLERTSSLDKVTNVSSSSSTATQPSSGYRGSSTMLLTDSQNSPATTNLNPLFVYRYDSITSSEASLMSSERQRSITTTAAPPLPKRSISLSHEKSTKLESVPPRPPLPKGILRKNLDTNPKRYSMFEMDEENMLSEMVNKRASLHEPYFIPRNKRLSETEDEGVDAGTSSSSLDEQMETRPSLHQNSSLLFTNIDTDELAQLEEFLKLSGISSSDPEEFDEESLLQLRSYVSKFLSLKMNQDGSGKKTVSFAEKINVLPKCLEGKSFVAPNNSPNVSAFVNQRPHQTKTLVDMPICEEGEVSPENYSTPTHTVKKTVDLSQKRTLVNAVTDAVEQIIHHFSPATNQTELNSLGDSTLNPACAKLTLSTLCPAIYAVLSDGLKPSLETSFGAIGNSVWQVVEASAQQGPLTKALNELVMRINGEDVITEGLIKFNAFVFGLLNVRSLDAWASYLRTRETILRKHYEADSLLLTSHTGGANVRTLLDTLVASLQPLALLPFHFDLLFEYRMLHLSFKRMDSYQQCNSPTHMKMSPSTKMWCNKLGLSSNTDSDETSAATVLHLTEPTLPDLLNASPTFKCHSEKQRPRSCIEPGVLTKPSFKLGEDVTSVVKKRWSGISLSSKLYQAFDRLAHEDDEEYTDSLENTGVHSENTSNKIEDGPESLDSNLSDDKPLNGRRFKKLQKKWEMLSGREQSNLQTPVLSPTHAVKSKIPRPVSSPCKPTGIPVLISPTSKPPIKINKKVTSPGSQNSSARKIVAVSKISSGQNIVKNSPMKKNGLSTRTSRVDQLESPGETPRHVTRPSSLPYKTVPNQGAKSKITPPRRAASSSLNRKTPAQIPKVVRTLSHRMPSESGHLPYNEGERLKVVLEVDDKWLLCCRGTQKGLVPKSAVIADSGRF